MRYTTDSDRGNMGAVTSLLVDIVLDKLYIIQYVLNYASNTYNKRAIETSNVIEELIALV